jgi:hypothetical protein
MSAKESPPNLLSKEEWKELDRIYWTLTQRTLDIHHMVQYYFGVRNRKTNLDPLMDLFITCNKKMRSALDNIVHMDFLDAGAKNLEPGSLLNLKPGLVWRDCPSTVDLGSRRYLTIFYNHEDELVSSYKPYDFGLKKPKRLQRCIPTEDRIKFMKDLTDLEEFVKMCRNKLRPLMTSSNKYAFDCALPKIESCKSIISTLP